MLGLLLASLLLGLLVPVYTDEVAWRFQMSRYLQDGFDHSGSEACGPNIWATPALFMLPVRMFSSTVTTWLSDPLTVRVAGVVFAILGVVGVLAIVRQYSAASERRSMLEILVLSLLGMGVLPFLLVWSRPEQPVWLAMLAALLLGFARHRKADGNEPWIRIAAITMLALIALSYHLKGLFYLPVFVLALVAAGQGCTRYLIRIIATMVIAAAAVSAYHYWTVRFACPDDPIIARKISVQNIFVLLAGGGWRAYLNAIPIMLIDMRPTDYIGATLPNRAYMSSWLPGTPVWPELQIVWREMVRIAWYIAMAIGAVLAILARREWRTRGWPIVTALILIGCATAWAGLQITKNAYEAMLYLPVMILALVALWNAPTPYNARLAKPVWVIAALSAASQVLLIGSYAAPLWAASRGGGYIAEQPYSLSAYAYPRSQILAAGAKCGIHNGPNMRRVLIDDLTYFAYADTAAPMHRLGILSEWNGAINDPMAWMRAHGSPGAVLGCAYLPPDMRARAVATGLVCCVATR